jgi:hypothetical protein
MVRNEWIEKQIAQGTTEALNEGMTILANHIGAASAPRIEQWEGAQHPLIPEEYDWSGSPPPGFIRYAGTGHSRVQVAITNKHTPLVMGGILAHELTHHFLYARGVHLPDTDENEKMTDLATVYLGLGKLTLNGYEPLQWVGRSKSKEIVYTYQVGYLSAEDIAQILHAVAIFRHLPENALEGNVSPRGLGHLAAARLKLEHFEQNIGLVGERQCSFCQKKTRFDMDDDGDVCCAECGWEWNALQERAKNKRGPSLFARLLGRK